MSDRELLELAAKAAGNGAGWHSHDPFHLYPMRLPDGGNWNPLDDDGDALRLAVRLGILLRTDFPQLLGELLDSGMERYAATRRAITRIAAEIEQRTTAREGWL